MSWILGNNKTEERFICKDCGKEYHITFHQKSWYLERNLQLPKRCPNCRKMRRK